MKLVPDTDYPAALAAVEKNVNTSPLMRSLANMDLEMKAILEDKNIPLDRKVQLYNTVLSRYRRALKKYKAQVPLVRVLPQGQPPPALPPAPPLPPPPPPPQAADLPPLGSSPSIVASTVAAERSVPLTNGEEAHDGAVGGVGRSLPPVSTRSKKKTTTKTQKGRGFHWLQY